MTWMETDSGRKFDFADMDQEAIDIGDIATSLSTMCRYNGHVTNFYSVAKHSMLVAILLVNGDPAATMSAVGRRFVRTALLHDAAEAYVGDMIRPLEQVLPAYTLIKKQVELLVAQRFDTIYPLPPAIKEIDTRLVANEREFYLATDHNVWPGIGDRLDAVDKIKAPYAFQRDEVPGGYSRQLFLEMFFDLED